MVTSDACPMKYAIQALLEYLVDPALPTKSSVPVTPSQSEQESVAKQVHAVVLLYNYYHRKRYPELKFMDFDSFCKLASIIRHTLLDYMKFMQRSNDAKLDDPDNEFSLLEKVVMEACDTSLKLDATRDIPQMEGWPISKVAVLVVDSLKENCLLLFSSITQGVWSVIEKELEISNKISENRIEEKHMDKKRRVTKKASRVKPKMDEFHFRQLAYAAVKKSTGITESDLIILESHIVYSLSKEKSAARFYIMKFAFPFDEDAAHVSIKDTIDILQGPLMRNNFGSWVVTPAVEYFHVLPYVGIVSDWFSRAWIIEGTLDSATTFIDPTHCGELVGGYRGQRVTCSRFNAIIHKPYHLHQIDSKLEKSPVRKENLNGPEIHKSCDGSHATDAIQVKASSKISSGASEPSKLNTGRIHDAALFNGSSEPRILEDGKACILEDVIECNKASDRTQHDDHQNITLFPMNNDLNDSANDVPIKSEMVELTTTSCKTHCGIEKPAKGNRSTLSNALVTCQSNSKREQMNIIDMTTKPSGECNLQKVADGYKSSNKTLLDQCVIDDNALFTYQSSSKDLEELQITIASKENLLSQTALEVLRRRSHKLSLQLRKLEDDIAQCDYKIQRILNGDESLLALKLETIIEGCTDGCQRRITKERIDEHVEDQFSSRSINSKKLLEAILNVHSPCQELDALCYVNNWMLPTYRVSSSKGGFGAHVALKGEDFEFSSEGDLHCNPREARELAATRVLMKLRSMAGQTQ